MTTTAPVRRGHLQAVNDAFIPAPAADTTAENLPAARYEIFAEDHDDACLAAIAPEVVEQQRALIGRAMHALSIPGSDLHAILLDYGRGMYVIGHMDAALAGRELPGPSEHTAVTLAEVVRLGATR